METVGMIVEELSCPREGGLECTGIPFKLENRLVAIENRTETVFFAHVLSVFVLRRFSVLESRSFWPSFIQFIPDENLLTLPSPPLPFLRHSYEWEMATFLDLFCGKLYSSMKKLGGGFKDLVQLTHNEFHCEDYPFVVSYFPSLPLKDKYNFRIFSKLLGDSYYFNSYDDVCESGWGKMDGGSPKMKGKIEGACYVQYIKVTETKLNKVNNLKVSVQLAVKNNRNTWQVILNNGY